MSFPQLCAGLFWLAFGLVFYVYFGYPPLIALAARLRPRPVRRAPCTPSASIVIAGWNEAPNLARRIANLRAQDYPAELVEIIVVSDGSTDNTAAVLEAISRETSRFNAILLHQNNGKAVALNAGIAAATGEIVVFADARQSFAPDAVRRLIENFADPEVGSVSGELVLIGADGGVAANVGLYWRYEKWIRRCESAFGSMLGATGAIYAIRRELYRPLPAGALLDDFLTPMRIVLAGKRAVFDGRALAEDSASTRAAQEFKRKVRTLAGNFQALAAEPGLLLPWRCPAAWFQVWSHKVLRLAAPWALGAMLLASAAVPTPFFRIALAAQLAFYGLALAGWIADLLGRPVALRPVSLAYTFVVLNLAAAAGFWQWITGRKGVWRKAYTAG